jgi:hypothetical protein
VPDDGESPILMIVRIHVGLSVLIVDDSDKWMVASYGQELKKLSPSPYAGKESTVIIVDYSADGVA